ncbi:DUF6263 family protein [Phormidesmis sp. 146-12]
MKKTVVVGSLLMLTIGLGAKPFIPAVSAKPNTIAQAAKPTVTPPKIELLTPGAQPQQPLRFKPIVNQKETATMTLNMDMKMSFGGNSIPSKLPSTVMKMETVVTKVDANGDIHYSFRYTDVDLMDNASLPPAVIKQLREQMKRMVGLSGSFVVNDRGQTKSGNFVIPPGIDSRTRQMLEQMSQSLDQFSSPLPDVAVGVGAQWRVAMPMTLNGVAVNQTANYELVSLKDGVATLKVALVQQANPQKLMTPGMPKGVEMTLKSLNSTGQGQTMLRLDRLLPTDSSISLTSNAQMQTTNPRSTQPMTIGTETQMEMTFGSK